MGRERKQRSLQYRQTVEAVAHAFQEQMKRRGINANQIARATGQQASTIGFILKGERPEMPAGTFFAICQFLELDPIEVWYGKASGKSDSVPPPASTRRHSSKPPKQQK